MNQIEHEPQEELPVVLPNDLLTLAPDDYVDGFNRAAAYRSYVSEQLVTLRNDLARVEFRKRQLKAQVRREAAQAGLQLSKQQLEDELLFDGEYNVASLRELDLSESRRRFEAALDTISLYIQGWSRIVELRRQELVLNPPAITRRDSPRKWV